MTKFPDPPVWTEFVGKTGGKPDSPAFPWEQWFQAVATFLSNPQIPLSTPKSSNAPGKAGTITYDTNFLYICVTANSWRRIALGTF